jgi:hypothetical protein
MKYLLVFSLFVLSFHSSVFAQEQSPDARTDYDNVCKYVMNEYGFDQVLVNGIFYEDKYWRKIGHQFFLEDQLYNGTLIYRGNEYPGVKMKYDIYDQQLVLYLKLYNSLVWIVPINDFVTAFSLGNKFFSKYNFRGEPKFYQVVYDTGKLKCLYYWFKQKYDPDIYSKTNSCRFTDSEKKNYLVLNDSIMTYRNNRSFIEIFPVELKARIRQYIRDNQIRVTKSSDEELSELLARCNSLLYP